MQTILIHRTVSIILAGRIRGTEPEPTKKGPMDFGTSRSLWTTLIHYGPAPFLRPLTSGSAARTVAFRITISGTGHRDLLWRTVQVPRCMSQVVTRHHHVFRDVAIS